MKIENQVISLEQAKKLKELGVEQVSYFYWRQEKAYPNNHIPLITKREFPKPFDADAFDIYAAFTVAELGEMLPRNQYGTYIDDLEKWQCFPLDRQGNYHEYKEGTTEAEARAAVLIHLLENKHITVEEVNKRLS